MERLPLQKRLGIGAILIGLAILVCMYLFNTPSSSQTGGGVNMPDIVEPIKETLMSGGGPFTQIGGASGTQTLFGEGTLEGILEGFKELGFSA